MPFTHSQLKTIRKKTPFFVFNKQQLLDNLKKYQECMPKQTEICYAMKSNSEKMVLNTLNKAGASFEVASKYELAMLKDIKVPAAHIIYGTAIKPEGHIKEFTKYGVDRFAFDSDEELLKIAKWAPKSKVYVRAHVNDKARSVFNMSEKFGTSLNNAVVLLIKAKELGLVPYGISFNVGSQARNVEAWGRGVADLAEAMNKLLKHHIKIQIINLGGGFPHTYSKKDIFPTIEPICKHICKATKTLPYEVTYIAEPGRGLVADTFVLVTSVIGKNKRSNGNWVYLDAGVYNALLESITCQGTTRYDIEALSLKKPSDTHEYFILTGPTGDNIDVINQMVLLPNTIQTGDSLLFHDVGAYTFTLITPFNGFPKPKIIECEI